MWARARLSGALPACWQKSLCGQRWEAVEGNWLLLTRGCQNGDAAAVHFQFQLADWNLPPGSPVSQAPFSEPMVWKTWFNSCSMPFIRFSISPNRLSVASYWRSNCASLWVECSVSWYYGRAVETPEKTKGGRKKKATSLMTNKFLEEKKERNRKDFNNSHLCWDVFFLSFSGANDSAVARKTTAINEKLQLFSNRLHDQCFTQK